VSSSSPSSYPISSSTSHPINRWTETTQENKRQKTFDGTALLSHSAASSTQTFHDSLVQSPLVVPPVLFVFFSSHFPPSHVLFDQGHSTEQCALTVSLLCIASLRAWLCSALRFAFLFYVYLPKNRFKCLSFSLWLKLFAPHYRIHTALIVHTPPPTMLTRSHAHSVAPSLSFLAQRGPQSKHCL